MAFLLLQRALPLLSSEQLPCALSTSLLRTLVNALDGSDRMLKPVAAATVRALVRAADASPPLRVALVTQLLGSGLSGGGFDRTTSTRALRQLLAVGAPRPPPPPRWRGGALAARAAAPSRRTGARRAQGSTRRERRSTPRC